MTKQKKHDLVKELYSYGLKINDIADAVGYSASNVSRILSGANILHGYPKTKMHSITHDAVDWSTFNPGMLTVD